LSLSSGRRNFKGEGARASSFCWHCDIILVMDQMNFRDVSSLARNSEDLKKIKLYLIEEDVEDPYYSEEDGFEKMYHILESKAEHWIRTTLQ
jgi:protein-tyrosine phosphatase